MIPFLLVLEYLSVQGMSLVEAVNPLRAWRTLSLVKSTSRLKRAVRYGMRWMLSVMRYTLGGIRLLKHQLMVCLLGFYLVLEIGGSIYGSRTQSRCCGSTLKRLRTRSFSLKRQWELVKNLRASGAGERRNSDGNLKILHSAREFELFSLNLFIFCHINARILKKKGL